MQPETGMLLYIYVYTTQSYIFKKKKFISLGLYMMSIYLYIATIHTNEAFKMPTHVTSKYSNLHL